MFPRECMLMATSQYCILAFLILNKLKLQSLFKPLGTVHISCPFWFFLFTVDCVHVIQRKKAGFIVGIRKTASQRKNLIWILLSTNPYLANKSWRKSSYTSLGIYCLLAKKKNKISQRNPSNQRIKIAAVRSCVEKYKILNMKCHNYFCQQFTKSGRISIGKPTLNLYGIIFVLIEGRRGRLIKEINTEKTVSCLPW